MITTRFLRDCLVDHCHKVSQRKGIFTARNYFYMAYFRTTDKFISRMRKSLKKKGLRINVLSQKEVWRDFPKLPYHEVEFVVY